MLNKTLIIKAADEGSVVVVMDLGQYLWEGQLGDTKYYCRLKTLSMETFTLNTQIFQKYMRKNSSMLNNVII